MSTPDRLAAAHDLQCHHAHSAAHPASPVLAAALHLLRHVAELTAQDRAGVATLSFPSLQAPLQAAHPDSPAPPSVPTAVACPRCEINERMAAMIVRDLVAPHLTRLGRHQEADEALQLVQAVLAP